MRKIAYDSPKQMRPLNLTRFQGKIHLKFANFNGKLARKIAKFGRKTITNELILNPKTERKS